MTAKRAFAAAIEHGHPILIDGGLATQCESMGCSIDGDLWSAILLRTNPQAIIDAHRAFLDAGAEIIITASYQASRAGFSAVGLASDDADKSILSSVSLASQARDEYLQDNPLSTTVPLIAASIGPYGAAMHDGSEYTGRYDVTVDALRDFHVDRLELLDASEADLLACETIPSFAEAQVLAELLRDVQSPAWVSFSCRDDKSINDGTSIEDAAGLFYDHPHVLAVGINCTAPPFVLPLIGRIRNAVPGKPIVVYPNSGEMHQVEDNTWSGSATATDWVTAARQWVDAGADLIGGCCRIGPEQIKEIAARL